MDNQAVIDDLRAEVKARALDVATFDMLSPVVDIVAARDWLMRLQFPSLYALSGSVRDSLLTLANRYDVSLKSAERVIYCRPQRVDKVAPQKAKPFINP